MTPEQLIDKMEHEYRNQKTINGYYCERPMFVCKKLLLVVLKTIEDGDVATGSLDNSYCVLKPEFKKFLYKND